MSNTKIKQIDSNTTIVFTLRSFFILIGSILAIFYGFYELVIAKRLDETDNNIRTMMTNQNEQNRFVQTELTKLNTSVSSLSTTIKNMEKDNNNNHAYNTSGSLSTINIYNPDTVLETNNLTDYN